MKEDSRLYWSRVLYWGLECGSDIVLFCVVGQWLWEREFSVTGFAPYLILSIVIYLCQKDFLANRPDMKFSELLLAGMCAGAAGSLIVDLYVAVYVKMYNPEIMEQSVKQTVELASQMGYPASSEEMADMSRKLFVPALMMSTTMVYTIVSLIFAALGAFMVNIRQKNNNNSK
jgi:hypothetical protein